MKTIYMITTRTCSKCPFERAQAAKFIEPLPDVELEAVDAFEPGGVGETLVREYNVKSTPTFVDREVGVVGHYAYELKSYLDSLAKPAEPEPEPESEPEQCSAAAKDSERDEEEGEPEQESKDKAVVHLLIRYNTPESHAMTEKVTARFKNEPRVALHILDDNTNAAELNELVSALGITKLPTLVLQRSNTFDNLEDLERELYSNPVFVCCHCGGTELTIVRVMKEVAPVVGFSPSGDCSFDRDYMESVYDSEYYICKKCGKVIPQSEIGKHLIRSVLVPGSDKNEHVLTLAYRISTDGDFRLDGFERFGAILTEYGVYEGHMTFVGENRFMEARTFLYDLLCDGMSFSSARPYCMEEFYNMVKQLVDDMYKAVKDTPNGARMTYPVRGSMFGNYDGTDFVLSDR